jgi:hypothetical protein
MKKQQEQTEFILIKESVRNSLPILGNQTLLDIHECVNLPWDGISRSGVPEHCAKSPDLTIAPQQKDFKSH